MPPLLAAGAALILAAPRLGRAPVSLPSRVGDRPRTTPTNPHTQLNQQPVNPRWIDELAHHAFALPGVIDQPSRISVRGARALVPAPDEPTGPPERPTPQGGTRPPSTR
jgi:hypothetical protein